MTILRNKHKHGLPSVPLRIATQSNQTLRLVQSTTHLIRGQEPCLSKDQMYTVDCNSFQCLQSTVYSGMYVPNKINKIKRLCYVINYVYDIQWNLSIADTLGAKKLSALD